MIGALFLSAIGEVIYKTQFLAGHWGIGPDDLATVTIERTKDDSGGDVIEEITITDPGRSVWDGLSLLGVPLSLALLGAWFQKSQQQQAADEAREEVLQVYFDRISVLLVDKNLMAIAVKGSQASAEEKELLNASLDVIRARTLSILRRFDEDSQRKTSVIRFLAEAEIISKLKLNLSQANLNGADLIRADLIGAKLIRAKLQGVDLNFAKLQGADLFEANLNGANLLRTDLNGAYLCGAILNGADLIRANLNGANLSGAYLNGAYLSLADLSGANLENISFDDRTKWPSANELAKARNIPNALKLKLKPKTPQPPPPPAA